MAKKTKKPEVDLDIAYWDKVAREGEKVQNQLTLSGRKFTLNNLILPTSPFKVPDLNTKFKWSASSIKQFRKCKRKFFWKYIMRLREKAKPAGLFIGTGFHDCLGEWYKGRRASMKTIAKRYYEQMKKEVDEKRKLYKPDQLDKVETQLVTYQGMMNGYAIHYEKDRENWDIRRESIEQSFEIDCGEFTYVGKIDLVATPRKKFENIVEHKTARNIGSAYIDRLPLDTQIRSYNWGATILGYKPTHVLYDVVRKSQLRRKANETITDFSERVASDYIDDPAKYFYREELPFDAHGVEALKYEVYQTDKEYKAIFRDSDARDPRSWLPNDCMCDEFFKLCEYHSLCCHGVDKASSASLEQSIREEIITVEEEDAE